MKGDQLEIKTPGENLVDEEKEQAANRAQITDDNANYTDDDQVYYEEKEQATNRKQIDDDANHTDDDENDQKGVSPGQLIGACFSMSAYGIAAGGFMSALFAGAGALGAYLGVEIFNGFQSFYGHNSDFSVLDAVVNSALGGSAVGIVLFIFSFVSALWSVFKAENEEEAKKQSAFFDKCFNLLTIFLYPLVGILGYLLKENVFGGSGISLSQSAIAQAIGTPLVVLIGACYLFVRSLYSRKQVQVAPAENPNRIFVPNPNRQLLADKEILPGSSLDFK